MNIGLELATVVRRKICSEELHVVGLAVRDRIAKMVVIFKRLEGEVHKSIREVKNGRVR